MEKRKDSLSVMKVCRFCLTSDQPLRSLYDRSQAPKKMPLSLKILSCISVEVFPSDKMPTFICNHCRHFMDMFHHFKQICRQADESILQFVQHGTALESVVWPSSLLKMYNYGTQASRSVVKTVVEGGATVEVSAQDISDSDDEDENVYNVKIEDGFDDESSACIKVVTSKDPDSPKEKPKRGQKDTEARANNAPAAAETVVDGGGCWACDECDCTYSLQQLLELHKMQKHRTRTVPCHKCDAMFFTKYDLSNHMSRHSDEMPFECSACDKVFRRLPLLKRHEKLMHSDLPQHKCPYCPATFLSVEEFDKHKQRHTRRDEPTFACKSCDKMFHNQTALSRHNQVVHPVTPELRCDYCPQRFSSTSKLARHVRSHAGERAYPCKFCDKSFVKSHHYTRHLRLKHGEMANTVGEKYGQTEQRFRCEQCEDNFATQDELIYHSAIHATQNLTCPLCQEKFDDVDAVTAHIKSHVNGVEFMCDLCELVFTSKEKLDSHMLVMHDDEIQNSQVLEQDESSMEMDAEEDEDESNINVKEEDGEMVVEIKKPGDFMISNAEEKMTAMQANINSEESETDNSYADMSVLDPLATITELPVKIAPSRAEPAVTVPSKLTTTVTIEKSSDYQNASILRRVEEMKRKQQETTIEKKPVKTESSIGAGASDKSLRLLEKELQELKRTNTRHDVKTPSKPVESLRSRRPQLHTSTPKLRSAEDKKSQPSPKTFAPEKKLPERRAVKENKEPKAIPTSNGSITKEKETKVNNSSAIAKDEKEKEAKEKDTPKAAVSNGAGDSPEEPVRRSTRPSKIKDYAKMIRDSSQQESGDDTDDNDDEEYANDEKTVEPRSKKRRVSIKAPPKTTKILATPPQPAGTKKRGRPRKARFPYETATKLRDDDEEDEEHENTILEATSKSYEKATSKKADESSGSADTTKVATSEQNQAATMVSPIGQTLKKVPIKALPPGIKPLPLPSNARQVSVELCEMQIGTKVVKVQKIVMTKAEVEAMAKKGLVEMKDGTMVLKQGIKIPKSDPVAIKSTLVGSEDANESLSKIEKGTPSRCDLGDDS